MGNCDDIPTDWTEKKFGMWATLRAQIITGEQQLAAIKEDRDNLQAAAVWAMDENTVLKQQLASRDLRIKRLEAGITERLKSGCNDTCSSRIIANKSCTCGDSRLRALLEDGEK